jgi:hypothetical protein
VGNILIWLQTSTGLLPTALGNVPWPPPMSFTTSTGFQYGKGQGCWRLWLG